MSESQDAASTVYDKMKAWAESPEGKKAMKKLAENHAKRVRASQPGTVEYYREWKANQDAIREWDEGPFY